MYIIPLKVGIRITRKKFMEMLRKVFQVYEKYKEIKIHSRDGYLDLLLEYLMIAMNTYHLKKL